MSLAAGGELLYAPVKDPPRILDFGREAGSWAIDITDTYPES